MLLNLKNNEFEIKGRGCTDGINQRNWIYKEDISSPTMSTEGLMISCMIYTMEGQYVETSNIPGDFLLTDYDKGNIHIKMEGSMVNLLEEIYSAY